MFCKVEGIYISSGTRVNKKTGEASPFIRVASGNDMVNIMNYSDNTLTPGDQVSIPCTAFPTQYGLFVKAEI